MASSSFIKSFTKFLYCESWYHFSRKPFIPSVITCYFYVEPDLLLDETVNTLIFIIKFHLFIAFYNFIYVH